MDSLLDALVFERMGPAEATVGMISLPLPREKANDLSIDHPRAGMQPLAWWVRNQIPRRTLACVVDSAGVPETLRLRQGKRNETEAAGQWSVTTRITKEKLDFIPVKYANVESLRGVPAENCTTVEFELLLRFGERQLALQCAATGPSGEGTSYFWQNVQVDRLWRNEAAEAIRVGGVIHNGDTYLWADLYLLLFSNGVVHAAVHFVNTKLHIEGYDFQGLPLIRFAADGLRHANSALPAGGTRFDLGSMQLNLADSSSLTSEEFPGSLSGSAGEMIWKPFSRTFNPQLENAPQFEWAPGFARTVRFQFSLSDAAPFVARYRAPSWWYSLCGEPWPGGYLPVHGRFDRLAQASASYMRKNMRRGRFDAGSAAFVNDGFAGISQLRAFYHTGRAELFESGLDYCYYWADLVVDHRDFTVHQWVGGWPWKTCAYSKFRDVLMGYLETGDPYLLDTVEMAADSYWAWFRSNWPRCTIGRDSFELGGWALLRRFLRTERAQDRMREFVRMIKAVLETRGVIGGQIGAGPHPGYLSSRYMTGVTMSSLLDVAEAELEDGANDEIERMMPQLRLLHERWMRDDVEMFPSNYGRPPRPEAAKKIHAGWSIVSARLYTQLARLHGQGELANSGLTKLAQAPLPDAQVWAENARSGEAVLNSFYHDALLLGAKIAGDGIEISPMGEAATWPAEQTVDTPWGALKINTHMDDRRIMLQLSAAKNFPVTVKFEGEEQTTSSNGTIHLGLTKVAQ